MIEATQTGIVDYPASPRPSLVDSVSMSYSAHHSGEHVLPRAEAVVVDSMWESWAKQITAFAQLSRQIGVDYLKIQPNQPMIDCKPGSNRYTIFDDYKTAEYLNDILAQYAPDVQIPQQINATEFLEGKSIDGPFVFKDISTNRGINKFLIETPEQERRLTSFLASYRKSNSLHDLMLEKFIETPTDNPTSYRYTITPTGTIIAASLLSASSDRASEAPKASLHFAALSDPQSSSYLGSPRITSNISTGGMAVGLDFPERRIKLAGLDAKSAELLEEHGIDAVTRQAPEQITDSARKIARAIGPSIGLILGVDILQQTATGAPYHIETNSLPSASPINETLHPSEQTISQRELKFAGMQQTLEDLVQQK